MKIREVLTKEDDSRFIGFPSRLYRGVENYIEPLHNMVRGVFDPAKNKYFGFGEATRFILTDDREEVIGRVAAFVNRKKAGIYQQPTGGMGFFECIDDRKAAHMLFDACRDWLVARGMEAMDGPINFGENDNFWGLLVEGFGPPAFGMNYHMPYYRDLFESYGFRTYYEQLTYNLSLLKPFPERFWKVADRVRQKPELTFKHFSWEEADKLINDVKIIYDDAWKHHEGFSPIDAGELRNALNDLKPLMEKEFIWFVYHQDEPAAFLVMVPDANEIFRHFNGRIGGLQKLRLFYYLKTTKFSRARVTVMGVRPKFQRAGLESGIFWHMQQVMNHKPHYKTIELAWVGSFNPKMKSLFEATGADFEKKHITCRYLFNSPGEAQTAETIR